MKWLRDRVHLPALLWVYIEMTLGYSLHWENMVKLPAYEKIGFVETHFICTTFALVAGFKNNLQTRSTTNYAFVILSVLLSSRLLSE